MSVSNPDKTISSPVIGCGDLLNVTLSFDASAELIDRPADIILIMDRSSSMNNEKIRLAKKAAIDLIDMVAEASGGVKGQNIANGSRMGLVTFADGAAAEVQLTSDVKTMENAVNAIVTGGYTNHKAAFETAESMTDKQSANDQIIIMFTDGITTTGGDAAATAESIKAAGTEIFCIGLIKDVTNLEKWASDPKATHVAANDDPDMLMEIFKRIAYEVILAGAHDVIIEEALNPEFKIVDVNTPTDGSVEIKGPQTLEWTMDGVGTTPSSKAVLNFDVMYVGTAGGRFKVNKSVKYSDRAGNTLTFPDPEVTVNCDGTVINPEPCPVPNTFSVEGCRDSVIENLYDVKLQSLGRIVQMDVPVRNICPGKRVAVAVILTETDADGIEHNRGMKTMLIPAQTGTECRDVTLKCINFVVPESLDPDGSSASICNGRTFNARVMANYVDTDFVCCDPQTVTLNS